MFTYEAEAIARAAFEDRVREATQRRLAREARGRGERTTPRAEVRPSPRRTRLWRLAHRTHAYG